MDVPIAIKEIIKETELAYLVTVFDKPNYDLWVAKSIRKQVLPKWSYDPEEIIEWWVVPSWLIYGSVRPRDSARGQ